MAELNVPNYMTNRPESISDLAQGAMRMQESGQNQQINQMKMAYLPQQLEQQNKAANMQQQAATMDFDLKKQSALKNIATDIKSKLQATGITEADPNFQSTLQGIYSNYGPMLSQITGKPYDPNEAVHWESLKTVAGLTPAEQAKVELQNKLAEQEILQPGKLKEIEAQAGVKFKGATDLEDYKRKADLNKPMPAKIIQEQNEALESVGNLSATNADLASFKTKLDSGKINLGLFDNISNIARGKVGGNWATDESRQYSELKNTLSKMRDESLMLNKGTQTEGDATRAWTSLFDNLTDNKYVSERLQEIQNINTRAAEIKSKNINLMRSEYSKEPIDMSGYEKQPTAFKSGYAKGEDVLKDIELGKISKEQGLSILNTEFKGRR